MNILIVSNQPIEKYQYLCIDIIKMYCTNYNIDFILFNYN